MKRNFLILTVLCIFIITGLAQGYLLAQEKEAINQENETTKEPGPLAVEPEPSQGPTDPAELEAFMDGIMLAHLRAYHIAGAAIAIVKDGKLFFSKGYGYADMENKKPVIADQTLFRTGSVAKLFTWVAVMQLVERGLIDLDADVNTYLQEFKIPDTFPEPITMKHLLTHSAGFEDIFTGMAVRNTKDIVPLGEYLSKHMPARVRPPGQITAYSNHGTALAGYIVETVSGMPFEKYIEENIFKPLGMSNSTFRQPLPPDLAENMSIGYEYKNGLYEAKDFELFVSLYPAGSMSCTVTDAAKFMIAHLNLGEYEGNRILKAETIKKMHTRLFANDPKTTGNAYGFWENGYNNLHIIDHGGDTIYFHTLLSLIPEKNLGFYVSYNTNAEKIPRSSLFKIFLDRYYPSQEPSSKKPESKDSDKESLEKFTGSYGMARTSYTTYEKIGGLFPTVNIRLTKKGNLLARSKQWTQVEPLVFKEVGGQNFMVFKENKDGKITHVFLSSIPHSALIKREGIEKPTIHYILLIICGLLFLSTWRWPLIALFKKICPQQTEKGSEPKTPRLLAGIMSTLHILTLIGIVIVFSDPVELLFGSISMLKILLVLPLIAVLLTIGTLYYTFIAWIKKYWTPCQRFHYTLVVLASIVFIWFLNYWNFLGFKL